MKRLLMLTALLMLFLLAACGSGNATSDTQSQSSTTSSSQPDGGYLNNNQGTEVLYIQWTESNGQFTGSWNVAQPQNNKITYSNLPISGTHDAATGSINFVLNQNGTQVAINGMIQNGQLLLQQRQNGQIITWTLHPASNVEYQSALAAFQSKYPGS